MLVDCTPSFLYNGLLAEHNFIQIDNGHIILSGKVELVEYYLPRIIKVDALVRSQHFVKVDLLLSNFIFFINFVESGC